MTKRKGPVDGREVLRVGVTGLKFRTLEGRTVVHRASGRIFRICVVPIRDVAVHRLRRHLIQMRCHFWVRSMISPNGERWVELSRNELIFQPQWRSDCYQLRIGGTDPRVIHGLRGRRESGPGAAEVASWVGQVLAPLSKERLERWIRKTQFSRFRDG